MREANWQAVTGNSQNDLGIRTDVLDGCPKAEGMKMLIRSHVTCGGGSR